MLRRVTVVVACVLGAAISGAGLAAAEELGPEQARAFVVGKLFAYTCFEGTTGMGRIFPDGSVVGTIRIRGEGPPRFAALPTGTVRVDGTAVCAHLAGLPITPCFRVDKVNYRSFRGSIAGLGFAYCDFYQRNPRTELISRAEAPKATSIATSRAELVSRAEPPKATPVAASRAELVSRVEQPKATPVANTRPLLRPSLAE